MEIQSNNFLIQSNNFYNLLRRRVATQRCAGWTERTDGRHTQDTPPAPQIPITPTDSAALCHTSVHASNYLLYSSVESIKILLY